MTGPGSAVIQHVAQDFSFLLVSRAQRRELGFGIRTHLGVRLARKKLFGFVNLTAELQIAAISDRDLRQRSPLLGSADATFAIRDDLGIEQHLLDLEKTLVISLKLFEHCRKPRDLGADLPKL